MVSSLIYILTRVLFITHFTPLSLWRGVGGEAVVGEAVVGEAVVGEAAGGEAAGGEAAFNYSVFFLLPGIYCRSSSR